MTFEESLQSDRDTLTIKHICNVVGISPERLMYQARTDPSMLGFPVIVAGRTVRVPRESFIAWMRGQQVQ